MKLTKELISVVLATVMLVCMSTNIFASINVDVTENSDIDVEEAYRFATEFLSDFYNGAHYISEDCDLSKYISNESFLKYMEYVYYDEAFIFRPGCIENQHVSFSLSSSKAIGSHLWLKIAVKLEFKYFNSDKTSHVNSAEELIISLENGNYVIRDYYEELWDMGVRGGITCIDNPGFWDDPVKAEDLLATKKEYVEARQRLKEEIDARSDELAKTIPPKEEPKQEKPSPYMIYWLDKNAMVEWAEANYNATILKSGNPSLLSEFRELYDNNGNFDCTNFASHALLAGGAPMYDDNRPGYSSGWFCRDDGKYTRSTSWASVTSFHKFLTNNITKGPRGRSIEYTDIINGVYPYEIGDFVQYYNGTRWCHTAIIVSFKDKGDGSGNLIPYVCYRSSPELCNDDVRYDYHKGITAYRILKIDGYYK